MIAATHGEGLIRKKGRSSVSEQERSEGKKTHASGEKEVEEHCERISTLTLGDKRNVSKRGGGRRFGEKSKAH